MLLGSLSREPRDSEARSAVMALRRGQALGRPPTALQLDLRLVDGWIRSGMLVEALSLLVAWPLDVAGSSEAAEWAELLGELLAPVPAHTEPVFVEMHRQLMAGGATVALSLAQDRRAEGPIPPWAERRLSLLRWMLLDNAQEALAARSSTTSASATTPLAAVLMSALSERSLERAHDAVRAFCFDYPDHGEARAVAAALRTLCDEMNDHGLADPRGMQTVPVVGRAAAAMQLQMASLQGAASVYRKLAGGQIPVPGVVALLDAVQAVLAALASERAHASAPPRQVLLPSPSPSSRVSSSDRILAVGELRSFPRPRETMEERATLVDGVEGGGTFADEQTEADSVAPSEGSMLRSDDMGMDATPLDLSRGHRVLPPKVSKAVVVIASIVSVGIKR